MKKIPLSKGMMALVDDEDFEWLSQRSWCVCEVKRKRLPSLWYAIHSSRGASHIYMHREIASRMGFSRLSRTDHRDGDGLNNQRINLRPATDSQNGANSMKTAGRSSKHKGVTWVKRRSNWIARIMCRRVQYNLGTFTHEIDAAKAYDEAAKIHFGEFARVNFFK